MSVYSLKRGLENQADPKLMKCFKELNKHAHVTLKQCELIVFPSFLVENYFLVSEKIFFNSIKFHQNISH